MPKGSEHGLGMAARNRLKLTRGPSAPHSHTSSADGEEVSGVGSRHFAEIVERENKSNNRNMGPTGTPSFVGRSPLPVMSASSRKTNKVG